MTFAIVYQRPDGWWLAGDGFVSNADALDAGDKYNWLGADWMVIPTEDLEQELCEEALEDWERAQND